MEFDSHHLNSIDALKGYATLLVFVAHTDWGMNSMGISFTEWMGALAVEIFLMISGYLLMSHHADDHLKLFPFLYKKLKHFYPLYLITLLAAIPLYAKNLHILDTTAWTSLILNIFLLQSWIPDTDIVFGYNSVAWYLSMLFALFILSPLIVRFWKRIKKSKTVLLIILSLLLLEFAWTSAAIYFDFHTHWFVYLFPLKRLIDYVIGAAFWKYKKLKETQKEDGIIFLAGIIICAILCVYSLFKNSEYFSVSVWILPCLMLLHGISTSSILSEKILTGKIPLFFAKIGFDFYLIHYLCILYLTILFDYLQIDFKIILALCEFSASVAITLLYRFIKGKISLKRTAKPKA